MRHLKKVNNNNIYHHTHTLRKRVNLYSFLFTKRKTLWLATCLLTATWDTFSKTWKQNHSSLTCPLFQKTSYMTVCVSSTPFLFSWLLFPPLQPYQIHEGNKHGHGKKTELLRMELSQKIAVPAPLPPNKINAKCLSSRIKQQYKVNLTRVQCTRSVNESSPGFLF